jgi:3-dehydroquinate synthase
VRVDLGPRSYDIVIGGGLLRSAGRELAAALPGCNAAIVTDEIVAALHLPTLRDAFEASGVKAVAIVVPPGERSKDFATLQQVVEALLAARLERGDAVVALGGGVIGDLAGFAAAIARRGMNLVQVPTTLLAQVDSSVGGKTGVNTAHGKNLVGAFYQPRLVLADTATLATLPPREFSAGYAEMAKYGLIADESFFGWLETARAEIFAGGPALAQAIATSCRAKARTVAADERETGERALLNLGHTFGHALEAACRYDSQRLIHGEAVAIGMALAHDFSADLGLAPASDADRVRTHLNDAGLPTAIGDIPGGPIAADELIAHIAQDKKVKGGKLTFILTRGIGKAFIAEDVAADRVSRFLRRRIG